MAARGLHRDRNFLIYLLGNTVSWLGTWAQRIGIGWLSWDLTHRTWWVGVISLAQLLPLVFFGPLFGALLDRHDHRRYALAVNVALSLLAAVLYLLTVLQVMHIGTLCGMAILLGIANSAYQAARLALVNDVVSPEHLPAAIAVNSVLFNVTRAVGPAIAGVIIARFGIAVAFGANAVSFAGILGALMIVRLTPRQTERSREGGLAAESLDGLRYVLQHRNLRELLLLSGAISIFGRGIVELFPAYADAVFHRGIQGLADFTTAAGVGAISGALVLSRARAGGLTRATRFGTLSLGLIVCGFGVCSSFHVAVLVAGLIGFMVVLCSVGLQVRLQMDVANEYRGRVLGLWIAVNVAGPGMGGALAGAAAQMLGLRLVTLASGLACFALVAGITWVSRRRR